MKRATERWRKKNGPLKSRLQSGYAKRHPEKVNALNAKRRAAKRGARAGWANDFFIREAYHLAALRTRIMGFAWDVDHIVPLRSPIVCGLHVHNNLQVIPRTMNRSKGNKTWPDMP